MKAVHQYNINSFFLQLLATKILSFVLRKVGTSITCELTRDEDDNFVSTKLGSWEGFAFCSKEMGGAPVEYRFIFTHTY